MTQEEQRLEETRLRTKYWKRWGPYLSERAWGTVREDYSANGTAWDYFPHDQARSKAYRWGEDGIAGICDRHQLICFALAMWNGHDPFLKERLFGLTGPQGNHGEDVKEYYFYLDSTPTHSYMKFLYKYPQAPYPYEELVEESLQRGRRLPEYELFDTGVFDQNRYFDVFVEYAKADVEDILIRITAINRASGIAGLDLLPTIWFRNTWIWGEDIRKPKLRRDEHSDTFAPQASVIRLRHFDLPLRWLLCAHLPESAPELLFTENETNFRKLYGGDNEAANGTFYAKDGINDFVVNGIRDAVNPQMTGTKASARYHFNLQPGEAVTIKLRLTTEEPKLEMLGKQFDDIFETRKSEADEFYDQLQPAGLSEDLKNVQRQAFAGMLWSKQYYFYDVRRWLRGDPAMPEPPKERLTGRNSNWQHLYNEDIISMPDKWEYPWYAAWDLAFHCIPLALIDPDFAKDQLLLMLREWYMHPNGQVPAYEWAFGDVNPPVHAWAAWRVYKIEHRHHGKTDRGFLERVFHKLLLNFTWWVNRKDTEGNNIFEGGFLGLDNIGVFDRSAKLPTGGSIEQSDATSWMGMYCLNLMVIALELAKENPAYEDVASKFLEHFVYISRAMNDIAGEGIELWDRRDGFFYDVLNLPNGQNLRMRVRSMVGLIPLFAVETLDSEVIDHLPGFKRRLQWFITNLPEFGDHIETMTTPTGVQRFLSLVNRPRLRAILKVMLDENEFLSPFGIRSLSRFHRDHPYRMIVGDEEHRVDYEPGESQLGLFGGNSNWRGPIWFPVNFLIIESLQRFHHFFTSDLDHDDFLVECPTNSGQKMNLWDVSLELSRRLISIFQRDANGRRSVYGSATKFQQDEHWRNLILFYEYFHGDNGSGLGASHQTGWTGLVAKLIQQVYVEQRTKPTALLDPKQIQPLGNDPK
ncbi:MAG: glucosidase [Acidobacteria bacterium]|nr:glucosidase [Acidobacteriota bacterium]